MDKNLFGVFSDSCPDRWGRLLMRRREAILAAREGRKPKQLFATAGRMRILRVSTGTQTWYKTAREMQNCLFFISNLKIATK